MRSMQTTPRALTYTAQCVKARRRYQPDRVEILFVAESPPSSRGYFYFSKTIGKDHLFRETMKALEFWPVSQHMGSGIDKRPLLEKFCSKGFFLIDTCTFPVDKLLAQKRAEAISKGAASIASRVARLDPANIIVVKKTVFRPVHDALTRAGLGNKILNKEPLCFPSHGNQQKFRRHLAQLIKFRNVT
ncbi:hypothetical protein J2P12_05250 [Candidatus Bathyarchaeota archaeon]|nr:hypothetical protein [Candidatus Bathyarchaeota archaeon]